MVQIINLKQHNSIQQQYNKIFEVKLLNTDIFIYLRASVKMFVFFYPNKFFLDAL